MKVTIFTRKEYKPVRLTERWTRVDEETVFFFSYVIIKYWYGNNSKNYYHWLDVLGLSEPAERNWIGEEKVIVFYANYK